MPLHNYSFPLTNGKTLTFPQRDIPPTDAEVEAALPTGIQIATTGPMSGEAANLAGQEKTQAKSGVWGSILRNAPEALKAYGTTLASVPSGIGHLLMSSPQQLHDEQLMPVVNAVREAVAHPSEIGPAFLQGAADPTAMGNMAGNLTALAALSDIPGTGRLITRGVAQVARPIDALAKSIPVQRAVSGAAAGATAAAFGLPGGEAADALIGAVLGQKTGAIGVIPEAEATKAVTTALNDLSTAKKIAASNPTPEAATTVIEARNLLKAAQTAQARSTTIGKLTTGLAQGLRWPDEALQRLGTPPAAPPSPPAPTGWTPEEWAIANAPPPVAPTVPLPPNPIAGAPAGAAQAELSTPGAQTFMAEQSAKNQPVAQATLGSQVGASSTAPTPGAIPPPSTVARLTDAAPPQHFDPNAATFDKATSAGGRFAPGTEPQPLPPPDPAIARDAVVDQNRVRAGVLNEITPPKPQGPPYTNLAEDLGTSPNVHGSEDFTNISPTRGTQADMRARRAADLRNPHKTVPEMRASHGIADLGKDMNPAAPEASAGGIARVGAASPSWMRDEAQMATLRDLIADPATLTLRAQTKLTEALRQLVDQYDRHVGPRPSEIGLKLFDTMKQRGLIPPEILQKIAMNKALKK